MPLYPSWAQTVVVSVVKAWTHKGMTRPKRFVNLRLEPAEGGPHVSKNNLSRYGWSIDGLFGTPPVTLGIQGGLGNLA